MGMGTRQFREFIRSACRLKVNGRPIVALPPMGVMQMGMVEAAYIALAANEWHHTPLTLEIHKRHFEMKTGKPSWRVIRGRSSRKGSMSPVSGKRG